MFWKAQNKIHGSVSVLPEFLGIALKTFSIWTLFIFGCRVLILDIPHIHGKPEGGKTPAAPRYKTEQTSMIWHWLSWCWGGGGCHIHSKKSPFMRLVSRMSTKILADVALRSANMTECRWDFFISQGSYEAAMTEFFCKFQMSKWAKFAHFQSKLGSISSNKLGDLFRCLKPPFRTWLLEKLDASANTKTVMHPFYFAAPLLESVHIKII